MRTAQGLKAALDPLNLNFKIFKNIDKNIRDWIKNMKILYPIPFFL
jgi:hypothetical protein